MSPSSLLIFFQVECKERHDQYLKHLKTIVEKSKARVPKHIKVLIRRFSIFHLISRSRILKLTRPNELLP